MELYALEYFVATIRQGGINAASRALRISAPAITKAIQRLEQELKCALFLRKGKKLVLSKHGQYLFDQAEELLIIVKRLKENLTGPMESVEFAVAGREVFLQHHGLRSARIFLTNNPSGSVRMISCSGTEAIEHVSLGNAHAAISIQAPPSSWCVIDLGQIHYQTCCAPNHPLYGAFKQRKTIPIANLLEYPFVSPNLPLFGRIAGSTSIDGWRDDVHPRKISYVVENLSLCREIIESGECLAYIPDFWAQKLKVVALQIIGCSFQTQHQIYFSVKKPNDSLWLAKLIDGIRANT